jgi:superfamily II DNA or RNA helicase
MLILSHRDELVHQPEKYFDCTFGVEQGAETSHGEEVVSASVQSLVRRLEKFRPDDFDVLVTDESHHATAPTYRKIYDYFKPRLHLGFTATPNRNDGVGLKAIYEDIIYERNLRWGIENGYLSNIHCLRVDIGVDLRRVAQRLGDYAPESLERAINIESANSAIAEAYRLYGRPPCLIFCASVAHAEALANHIPGAVAVRGGEDRSGTVQAFSEGKIPCVTNCMVFTEGTDLPKVQTVIVARPTRNVSLYCQMAGRGTRLYPGKEYLTLIDCVGACDEADLCSAPSLLGLDIDNVPAAQRKKLTGNLFDLPEIITELEDTPEAWIRNVERVDLWARRNRYDMHGVNYFKMPDGSLVLSEPKLKLPPEDSLGRIMWKGRAEPAQKVFDEVYQELQAKHSGNRALWDLSLTRSWGNSPATARQKELIRKYQPCYDPERLTKFEAGQILTRCFADGSGYEPPTAKQIYVLRQHGYEVSGLSKYDAMKIIRRFKKND